MPQDSPPPHDMAARHDPIYETLHASDDFAELRRRYRGFAIPATVGFLAWFLLYVVLSNWATGFMSHRLFGNINVALVFGLLQFLTTFGIAYLYSRYSIAKLDPLSEKLEARFEKERSRG
ncbi:DUF485 domain-containing protein [Nocardioides plantarum]|uniref:DUF485 domain-containing protein n=1 Tax=Nocardioides plantarum TaxID=29299 RepID=A0ABV5K510_9ACTN|nr:DUF485 domain-containing protein [Nocardioides plantarum]